MLKQLIQNLSPLKQRINLLIPLVVIGVSFALSGATALAQGGNTNLKTNAKITYHVGPLCGTTQTST